MKIVMDLVVNHTSDEHPWFTESRASNTNPKRDWYWWRPPRPGHEPGVPGAEPTNWMSFFGGSAWEYDEQTGEYFLHLFSKKQPDLNWENPEVRTAVYAMMRRWLDRGVDGFRMDVINMISKESGDDGELADGIVFPGTRFGWGGAFFMNGPRIHEFLQEMNREVLAGRNLITVGEMPDTTVADAILYTDPDRHEVDMVFTFEHVGLDREPGGSKWAVRPLHLPDLKVNLATWQEGLAEVGWNSLYWNNHDQPRIVSRWGNDVEHRVDSAKTLGTVLHMLRGTPYVYQGEELAMTNAHFTSPSQYRDIESVNWAETAAADGVDDETIAHALSVKSRDNARTPMQWTNGTNAGFTDGDPWLPANPNHASINAEAAIADPESVFHHYRRLIELRHHHPVVVHGDFRLIDPAHEQVFAYVRTLDDTTLLVVANMSDESATFDLGTDAALASGDALLSTHSDLNFGAGAISLRPWESHVLVG
jgi:oligo-1,6-glucosidase